MKKVVTVLCSIFIMFGFFGEAIGQVTSDDAWINEFHYDNDGADVGEFIEVIIKNAGNYDLGEFTLHLYNGSNGESYGSHSLDTFTEGDTEGDYKSIIYQFQGFRMVLLMVFL